MKPISVARIIVQKVEQQPLPKRFILRLLDEQPEVQAAIVTLRVADGAVMGINLGRFSSGAQTRCTYSGKPVSWCEINGVPCWGRAGLPSYGPYLSRECTREELISFLS